MLNNFVLETVNAPGTTASVNLVGAVTGRKRFRDKFASGATTFYYMEDGTNFECGMGVLTYGSPDTYNRQTVLDNSSGTTSRINFAGTTRIYCEVPAQRALWRDVSGNLDLEGRFISALWWGGTSTGTASAYVVTLPKAVTAYAGGFEFKFRPHVNCNAGATLNIGQGAKPIYRAVSTGLLPVQAAEICQGQIVHLIYDSTLDVFQIVGPPTNGLQVPIGTWIIGGWSSLPPGCLWPDGRNVSRTTYAALFAVYGTTFGAGNGSTTFGLPDLRGRTVFGKDNMGGTAANRVTASSGISGATLGASGGSELVQTHSHGVNDPGHGHGVNDPGHSHSAWTDTQGGHAHQYSGVASGAGGWAGGPGPTAQILWTDNQGSHQHGIGMAAAATGVYLSNNGTGITIQNYGSGGSQNMPPSFIGNIVIFAGAA